MSEILNQVLEDFQDTATFARESLSILTKQGKIVSMNFTDQQHKLDRTIKKIRDRNKPVRLVICKYRRGGFSSGTAAIIYKETVFRSGQESLVVAHEGKAVKESLFPMYSRFNSTYRPFRNIIILPELVSNRKDGLDYSNGSSISIQTANNLEAARSFNYRKVHLSEFAFYRNARTLMAALMQTIPDDPDTVVIVESTANGLGNDFHNLYQLAKSGKSEWVALFFGWNEDKENVRQLDEPADKFQSSLSDDEKLLMIQYSLSLEQLNWRRYTIANKCNSDTRLFQQEYPINDIEAFLVTGRPYFLIDTIQRQQPEPGFVGELKIEQVSMREQLVFRPNKGGALTVWERPDPHKHYVIGVDPAGGADINEGIGNPDPDFSVASVGERASREHAAQLRERIQPTALADYVYELGRWYNWAYVVPEVNSKIGVAFIDRLLAKGYPPARIYKRKYTDKQGQAVSEKFGWLSNEATRTQLLGYLQLALLEGTVILKSDVSVQELFSFVIHPDGKAAAALGSHDDCVFADGYMVVGFNQAPKFEHEGQRKVEVVRGQTMRQAVVRAHVGGRSSEDDWND